MEDIWQKDGLLLTYAAVLEAERPDTLRGACELPQNPDNYQRITEYAYGYGQDCMENDCVTETEFGLLRRLDPPFPEQTQGQRMM